MSSLGLQFLEVISLAAEAGGGGTQGGGGGGMGQMLVMFLPLIIIFYLIIWRPEKKRRQEKEQLVNSLEKKDKAWTIGGLHGTIVDIDKEVVTLLIDSNKDVKIKVRRSAIDTIEKANAEKAKAKA